MELKSNKLNTRSTSPDNLEPARNVNDQTNDNYIEDN